MIDTARHVVESVLPEVPWLKWVCSLPWRLRYFFGYAGDLCPEIIGGSISEVTGSRRRRAKRLYGLKSVLAENPQKRQAAAHPALPRSHFPQTLPKRAADPTRLRFNERFPSSNTAFLHSCRTLPSRRPLRSREDSQRLFGGSHRNANTS